MRGVRHRLARLPLPLAPSTPLPPFSARSARRVVLLNSVVKAFAEVEEGGSVRVAAVAAARSRVLTRTSRQAASRPLTSSRTWPSPSHTGPAQETRQQQVRGWRRRATTFAQMLSCRVQPIRPLSWTHLVGLGLLGVGRLLRSVNEGAGRAQGGGSATVWHDLVQQGMPSCSLPG